MNADPHDGMMNNPASLAEYLRINSPERYESLRRTRDRNGWPIVGGDAVKCAWWSKYVVVTWIKQHEGGRTTVETRGVRI